MIPRLFDSKLTRRPKRYLGQIGLASGALVITIWAAEIVTGFDVARAVLIAAVASTAFILFITPNSAGAMPRRSIGGHSLACVVGIIFSTFVPANEPALFALCIGGAVGLAMLAMAVTDTEHAPAAGTAFAMSASSFSWALLGFMATGIIVLAAVHMVLKKRLEDLS